MGEAKWLDSHLNEIKKYQVLIERIKSDDTHHLITKINLMSEMLVFIGKVSAELAEQYKNVYAERKSVWAKTYKNTKGNKAVEAELAIEDLRKLEAKLFGEKERWKNAFDSTKEEINALKYKVKISIEDGSSRIS